VKNLFIPVAAGIAFVVLGLAPAVVQAAPGPVYANCTEVHDDGAYNIPQEIPAGLPGLGTSRGN
jgi:hypothetical protein